MMMQSVGGNLSPDLVEAMREDLGLNKPFIEQYGLWLSHVLQGELGISFSSKLPVVDTLKQGLPGTLLLAGTAFVLYLLISIPAGIYSAVKANRWQDTMIRTCSFISVSMPSFWLGLLFLYIFGLKFGWVPIVNTSIWGKSLIFPALTLAIVLSAKFTRQVRTVVLEELNQDYVMGARARGLSESRILWRHVLPNAMMPLITVIGMGVGWLLAGVAVIEIVFAWPGMGKMAVHAITMRDYPLVQGFVLWVALVYTGINFLVDFSYTYLDPRLKRGGRS